MTLPKIFEVNIYTGAWEVTPHTFGNISYFIFCIDFSAQGFPKCLIVLTEWLVEEFECSWWWDRGLWWVMFPSNLHHSAAQWEEAGVGSTKLSNQPTIFATSFQTFRPGSSSTGNTVHWGSPLGIGKLKTYFLVYELLSGLCSSLISVVLAGCFAFQPHWLLFVCLLLRLHHLRRATGPESRLPGGCWLSGHSYNFIDRK